MTRCNEEFYVAKAGNCVIACCLHCFLSVLHVRYVFLGGCGGGCRPKVRRIFWSFQGEEFDLGQVLGVGT